LDEKAMIRWLINLGHGGDLMQLAQHNKQIFNRIGGVLIGRGMVIN